MSVFSELRERLRALIFSTREDAELEEELRVHLEMQVQANEASGMSAAEARRQATLAFGGQDRIREETRDARGVAWLEVFGRDIRFALRSLLRNPGFTTVALLTIALGIGANAAMFGLVNGILLRPLPYGTPERLVVLRQLRIDASVGDDVADHRASPPDLEDWRARTRSLAGVSGSFSFERFVTGHGEPLEVRVAHVVEDFFQVLDAPVLRGRPLLGEDIRGARTHVVISERLWRTQLGADPRVLGGVLRIDGEPYTVVGIATASFRYPSPDVDVWMPHSLLTPNMIGPPTRDNRLLDGVARLAPGVTLAQAQRELNDVAAQLATEYPETNADWTRAEVVPLHTALVGDVDRALLVVLAVVGFILLIACANLANLLLARGSARMREIGIRTALGAGRGRLIAQLLTESLVLALLGGALGLLLSYWGLQAVITLSADTLPRVEDVRIDGRVIGFGLLLATLTGLLFGLVPAFRLSNRGPQAALRGGRGAIGADGGRLRGALVVAEVALAVLLVVGAGLMARSFLALRSVDTGYQPEQVLTATVRINMPESDDDGERMDYLFTRRDEMIARALALPGVIAAGTTNVPPIGETDPFLAEYQRRSGAPAAGEELVRMDTRYVSTGFFDAMGIRHLRGARFPERLADDATIVPAVINQAAARRYWQGEEAIGQRLHVGAYPQGFGIEVVGIVSDVRQVALDQEPGPAIYMPQSIAPRIMVHLVVRAQGEPAALVNSLRSAIREIDPNQPVRRVDTLATLMGESIARDRFFTVLFAVFGSLALGLAAVGIYGVLAYNVRQRTQEIGVRMALGASGWDVVRMMGGAALRLIGIGIGLGTAAALLLTRVMESLLFGVTATDPVAFAGALAFLGVVGMLASWLPARRATRVSPTIAIRAE